VKSITIAVAIAGGLAAGLGWAQDVEVQSLSHNGDLTWIAPSGSACSVEWAGSLTPTPEWESGWGSQRHIVISNGTGQATVPMFYRVMCATNARALPWRLAKLEWDSGNDGTIDGVKYFSYDSDGDSVSEEEDENNDGTNEFVKYYFVDTQGNVVKELEDNGPDGVIEHINYNTYSNGLKVRVDYDNGNNGHIDKVNHRYHDAQGRTVRSEWDEGNDGSIDEINYFFYNSLGDMIRSEVDEDNDGSIDLIETNYWYNAAGNLIRQGEDEDGNGILEGVGYWSWEIGPKAHPLDWD